MNVNEATHLKKSWLIGTMIARELILHEEGDRLPAIQEYADRLCSSRGIVQNAFRQLQEKGAVILEKRGKHGTFFTQKNLPALLEAADLQYITASMAPPINTYFAGLATGVCLSFASGPAHFNFAFMHSSENRAKALHRMVYDFMIVSGSSASTLVKRYPDLEVAMLLDGSCYSPPLSLWSNRSGAEAISDGDSIAVDKNSNDQYEVTMRLCEGKDVRLKYEPYLATRLDLIHRKVDFVVLRENEVIPSAHSIAIGPEQNRNMTVPAVLVNRNNYGMDQIVRKYLDSHMVAQIQKDVMEKRREPEFY